MYSAAFGHKDLSENIEMKSDDLFYIQSMTKPIITVAFMTLYEEGHFQLTDPVLQYLPAFKELKVAKDITAGKDGEMESLEREVRISDLLSHTAGFSHGLGSNALDRYVFDQQYEQEYENIQERVNNLLTLPLVGQPGEQWYYSAAPDVLSVLIEYFSGKPTLEVLQERIFDPLGMTDTGYNIPKKDHGRMVSMHYHDKDGNLLKSDYQVSADGNTIWSGVNGLFSTASDYMKFCTMMLNGGELNGSRILSRKTVQLMTTDHTDNLYQTPGEGFGLGFAVVDELAETKGLGSNGLFYWGGPIIPIFISIPRRNWWPSS